MSTANWRELLDHWAAGDRAAFESLYTQYRGELLTRISFLSHGREDSEDILHSIFRSLAESSKRWDGADQNDPDGLRKILLAGATRHCGSHRRYASRHPEVHLGALDPDGGTAPAIASEGPSPEDVANVNVWLREFCEGRVEGERVILYLRLEGYFAPEIAARVGLTPRQVRTRLDWIRTRLCKEAGWIAEKLREGDHPDAEQADGTA